MKKLRREFSRLSQAAPNLLTIFLGTMLATSGNATFLNWVASWAGELDVPGRIALTIVSTVVYCSILAAVYFTLLPRKQRAAVRRKVMRKG